MSENTTTVWYSYQQQNRPYIPDIFVLYGTWYALKGRKDECLPLIVTAVWVFSVLTEQKMQSYLSL